MNRKAGKEVFKTSKALVVGVSADPVEKQKEFVEKQKLTVRSVVHIDPYK